MELRNALHTLRTHRPVEHLEPGGTEKRTSDKTSVSLRQDNTTAAAATNGVFQLDTEEEDFDIDFSDDEFFKDADLLSLFDGGSQTTSNQPPSPSPPPPPPPPSQHSMLQSHHHLHSPTVTSHTTQPHHYQPRTNHTLTTTSQRRQTPSSSEISPQFKPPVSSRKHLSQQGSSLSSTSVHHRQPRYPLSSPPTSSSQRLQAFRFTKLPLNSRPVNVHVPDSTVEERPAKKMALDCTQTTISNTTSVASSRFNLLLSSASQPSHQSVLSRCVSSSGHSSLASISLHTPERSRVDSCIRLSQREAPLTPLATMTMPLNASITYTSRDTHSVPSVMTTPIATPIATPTRTLSNRSIAVTPNGGGQHVRRKFPGPAGVLPKLTPGQSMNSLKVVTPLTASPVSTPRARRLAVASIDLPCSADTQQEFNQGPWIKMMEELKGDGAHPSPLLQHCISDVLKQASQRKLASGKVPFLGAMIKSIVPSGSSGGGASAVLKDLSGEMLASVHFKVMSEYQSVLQPGSVLVLYQTSVFSPSRRKHYLNVTLSNLVCVYPQDNAAQTLWCCGHDRNSLLKLLQDLQVPPTCHLVSITHNVVDQNKHVAAVLSSFTTTPTTPTTFTTPTTITTTTTSVTGAGVCYNPSQLMAAMDDGEFDSLLKDMDDSFLDF